VTAALSALVFPRAASPRWLGVGCAVVAAVAALAYARVLSFGFVYDDYWTIVTNTHLERSLLELVGLAWSGKSLAVGVPDATRPLMGWSSWLDRRLFGLEPWAHHLHSLLLYAAVVVSVYLLVLALSRRRFTALCASLLFAVSPMHAEVVASINYREDLLAALGTFAVLALCFWPRLQPSLGVALAAAALWAMALLGKESALALPLVFLALRLARPATRVTWTGPYPLALALCAVGVAWLNWRWGMQAMGDDIPRATYATFDERLYRTARFLVSGGVKALAPLRGRTEYGPLPAASAAWLALLLAAMALVVWLARNKQTRLAAAALGVALCAPLATSPLFAPVNERADRYWFVASLAGALLGAVLLTLLARRALRASLAALLLLVGAGFWGSWSASGDWASESSLWASAVKSAPGSARAWMSLSRVHRLAGQPELARRAAERALELRPGYVPARITQSFNALWVGDTASARAALAGLKPARSESRAFRLAARCAEQPPDEARACIQRTVPQGLVLGDTEALARFTESILSALPTRG
jgi:tetratricopeptide (TPR) repeat protein